MGRLLAGALALLALGVSGCGMMGDPWGDTGDKVRVIVTIPPLASFVYAVGGERVAVKCLCTTVGPHQFDTNTSDLAAFRTAKLFLGVGLTLDDKFSRDLYARARRKELPFVRLGTKLPEKQLLKLKHDHDEEDEHEHEGHHHHGQYDPHVWLGIPEAIHMVNTIRDELSQIDPEGAEEYKKNARNYVEKLKNLQKQGEEMLKEASTRRIITFHDSFGYFARTFKLDVVDVIEPAAGDEPTPGEIDRLVKLVKDNDKLGKRIGCITVEPQYKRGSAHTVQTALAKKKVEITVVEVDPMETADAAELEKEGADWYINRMVRKKEGKKPGGILVVLADTLVPKKEDK
jgi:ABC-type Zn uptake system ZnuABC Zn-binding protein ZnuA